MSNQNQPAGSKAEFNELMIQILSIVEDIQIPEGAYLQIADAFKQMNINLDALLKQRTTLVENVYYTRFVRPSTKRSIKHKKLGEAQKSKSQYYYLCSCGRYEHKDCKAEHYRTLIHHQGLRTRKYACKRGDKDEEWIDLSIQREIALDLFNIKHRANIVRRERQATAGGGGGTPAELDEADFY